VERVYSLIRLSHISRWAAGLEALIQAPVWSREQILAFQTRRLQALVRHASRRVPYYRRLFEQAGLRPDDIRSLDDLSRIPITSRADLQRLPPGDALAEGAEPEKLVLHLTSGTSGEPLRIRRTYFEEYLLQAFRLREQLAFGMRLTDRRASVGLARRPAGQEQVPGGRPFYSHLGLLRREPVHSLLPAEEILARLRALGPDVLEGFGGSIAWIAGSMTEEDRARIRPRLVFTGAETLTPEMRQQILQGFGAPSFNFYGSHEYNLLASECPRGGRYHVTEWNVILEVFRDGRRAGPGEEGEVVATALHSYTMPFIRFRLNDLVTLGDTPCSCGAPVSTISRILGRTSEQFLLPDGKLIHPYVLVLPLMSEAPWLRRYQIVQDRTDRVLVKIIPLTTPSAEAVAAVARRLAAALEGQLTVEIELVEDIPPGPNGKYRPYFSLVKRPA
jgi:phenylacetate-CoA ligase